MQPPLDSDLLRTFVAIADAGSFTVAARNVGRTQSAVSMQVKRLEEIAGKPLFRRHRRGISLNAAGEGLMAEARRIVLLLDRATESMRGTALGGGVRIGIPEEYGATVLPAVLARFAATHPGVQVTVRSEQSVALDHALAAGDLDVAVLVVDGGYPDGEVLVHDPTVWVTSAGHLAHEQEPLPVAMFDQDCWWRDRALKMLDRAGRRYRVAYSSPSIGGLQAAVAAGLAVGVLGLSTVPAGCRVLTAAEGFRELPGSNIVLRMAGTAPSPAAAGMAESIRLAFGAMSRSRARRRVARPRPRVMRRRRRTKR